MGIQNINLLFPYSIEEVPIPPIHSGLITEPLEDPLY